MSMAWRVTAKHQPAHTRFAVPAVDAPNVNGARALGLVPGAVGPAPRRSGRSGGRLFERLRWLTIIAPAVVVGLIELLSDTFLDPYLPFPWDTLIVAAAVLALSFAFSTIAFRRIDALAGALAARRR